MVLLAESATAALRAYIGNRESGYVFEADYKIQKGHFSAHHGKWTSKWQYTRKEDLKRVQKSKILGATARMTYEEAKQKHEALMATLDLSLPKRSQPLSKVVIQHIVANIGTRARTKHVTPAHLSPDIRDTFARKRSEPGSYPSVVGARLGTNYFEVCADWTRWSEQKL